MGAGASTATLNYSVHPGRASTPAGLRSAVDSTTGVTSESDWGTAWAAAQAAAPNENPDQLIHDVVLPWADSDWGTDPPLPADLLDAPDPGFSHTGVLETAVAGPVEDQTETLIERLRDTVGPRDDYFDVLRVAQSYTSDEALLGDVMALWDGEQPAEWLPDDPDPDFDWATYFDRRT